MATHNSMIDIVQQSAAGTLAKTDLQILRASDDLYRKAAAKAGEINFREGSILTRQSAAQTMMNDFNQQGITAITYKNGTKMPIDSYSEMAGQTMSGNAAVQGSLNRYQEYGFTLFKISAHFQTCKLCAPWENKVISVDGRNKKYPTLNDAIRFGYGHPRCIHTLSPWREGFPITEPRLDPAQRKLVDKHGYKKAQEVAYKAQQRQRAIERNIKKWKMRNATSLDPRVAAKSKMKVSQWQAAQREHLKTNSFLRRDYAKESIRAKTMFVDVNAQANQLAKDLRRQYSHQLREVTDNLKDIRDATGTKLEGLRYRMKGEGSLTRKIADDFKELAGAKNVKVVADTTGDVIRYTYVIDDANYATKMNRIIKDLQAKGFKNYKFKNYWGKPDYRGINTNWYYKGRRLEIQFHTPTSIDIKERLSHPLYEKLRVTLDPVEKARINAELAKIWARVPVPKGSAGVGMPRVPMQYTNVKPAAIRLSPLEKKAVQYTNPKEFIRVNIKELKAAGVTSPEQANAIWKRASYQNSSKSFKAVDMKTAVNQIETGLPSNLRHGWFREADSAYKPKIENVVITNPELRNAGLNIAHQNYMRETGVKMTFEQFLNTPINVYRGGNMSFIADDVFISYSYSHEAASKFGGNVISKRILPKDTLGSFQTTGEMEILLPRWF